jgi:hypothetical protein
MQLTATMAAGQSRRRTTDLVNDTARVAENATRLRAAAIAPLERIASWTEADRLDQTILL